MMMYGWFLQRIIHGYSKYSRWKIWLYWVTMLIKVIMCELPDCFVGFHRHRCLLFRSVTALSLALTCLLCRCAFPPHICCAPFVLVSGSLWLSNPCCHYHPSLWLKLRYAWETCVCQKRRRRRRRTESERKKGTEEGRGKCDSWGSASGCWVQKGQDLELAVLFSTACLLSLGNANQTTCEPLPSLSPPKKSLKRK